MESISSQHDGGRRKWFDQNSIESLGNCLKVAMQELLKKCLEDFLDLCLKKLFVVFGTILRRILGRIPIPNPSCILP